MEDSEGFKGVVGKIKALEHQLSLCEEAANALINSSEKAEREIEEHFAKCEQALAARKASLLSECAKKLKDEKIHQEETRVLLKDAIEGCKKSLEAGAFIFTSNKDVADGIWKATSSFVVPSVPNTRLRVKLPTTLMQTIHTHGQWDIINGPVRVVAEMITTFAGSTAGYQEGEGMKAKFKWPSICCWNPHDEHIYICDRGNGIIRKLSLQGAVSTFAKLDGARDIVMNYKTQCFFATCSDSHSVFKIDSSGNATIFAGDKECGFEDGIGTSAKFNAPAGLAINQATGDIYVCDSYNNAIRTINPTAQVATLAGSEEGFADGTGKSALFSLPVGIAYDEEDQSVLVCDLLNDKIRRVLLNGRVTTACECNKPSRIAATGGGDFFVSSYAQNKIFRMVKQESAGSYTIQFLAGSGKPEGKDGKPEECGFNGPRGMTVHHQSGSCFVCDRDGHTIRRISFS